MARRKSPAPGGAPAAGGGVKVPTKYMKPAKETPLAAVFAGGLVGAGAAGLVGGGLAAAAPAVVANLMYTLGYSTVEEALNVIQVAKRQFVQRLGLSAAAIDAFVQALLPHAPKVPSELAAAITAVPDSFGYLLGAAHRSLDGPEAVALLPTLATATAAGGGAPPLIGAAPAPAALVGTTLPASVNLIPQLPSPVRDQNPRNTCVPHGTLVAYEHYLWATTGTTYDLSEQFLFWACKQRDGHLANPAGTTMAACVRALEQAGACQEADWPYSKNNQPDQAGNPGHDPPPAGATLAAAAFRPVNPIVRVAGTVVNDYKTVLASGRCVAFAVPVYNSNFNPQASPNAATVYASGRITLPAPGEQPIGGHCMCMVGYEDDATVPALGGGRFIIRNSFGPAFGATSAYGPGYGTIPYAYVASRGQEFGIAFM